MSNELNTVIERFTKFMETQNELTGITHRAFETQRDMINELFDRYRSLNTNINNLYCGLIVLTLCNMALFVWGNI